jgi:hypothetical protein
MLHLLMDQTEISDVINESNYLKDFKTNRKIKNRPNGFSLLTKVPDRNCNESNIPEHLCSCGIHSNLDLESNLILKAAEFCVYYINNILLKNYRDICEILQLSEIIDAQLLNRKYSIIFKTKHPAYSKFDATFELFSKENEN